MEVILRILIFAIALYGLSFLFIYSHNKNVQAIKYSSNMVIKKQVVKVAQIVGARPQFIKYSPISQAIDRFNSSGKVIENILIHSGQHYDYAMSDIFFNELGIKEPQYHLGVGSGSHGIQTGHILQRAEKVLLKEKPDLLLVYGDTNTTLGGALAAVKLLIPVAHIEAGLRSYNKYMPEEVNRILTDHSSSVLFCPTEAAVENLRKEGFRFMVNEGKPLDRNFNLSSYAAHLTNPLVFNVGDVMYDALLSSVEIAAEKSHILENLDLAQKEYSLLTLHRAENTNNCEKLEGIIDFVNDVSAGKTVIFPVHPRAINALNLTRKTFADNVKHIKPVGYFDMIWLLKNSARIFTDSGGLQKEAYWLKIPCITLRDETEWIETVQSGWNILYRDYKGTHNPSDTDVFLYGNGKAAEKIVDIIVKYENRLFS